MFIPYYSYVFSQETRWQTNSVSAVRSIRLQTRTYCCTVINTIQAYFSLYSVKYLSPCPLAWSAIHPLQVWMHPLEICKISKTNMLISLLKKNDRHPTYLCCTAVVRNNSFSEMHVYARCFVQCNTTHYVFILSPDKGPFYAYTYIIYIQYMYNRALYTYINVSTYTHPHWKPLHPLCSLSGYGPVHRMDKWFR
jgi:hypothetical protein